MRLGGWRRFRPPSVSANVTTPSASDPKALLDSLLAQTPAAVRAQRSMDSHPHSYHTNKVRLYELIDFNDTFVSLALALEPADRHGFIERLRLAMQRYCKEHDSPMFSDEQFDAITRGLSREVAVYLGARQQGYEAAMTSRREDAMGVDMVLTDPATGRLLNIDCKTSSAFHFRLKDLVHQGRLTHEAVLKAEQVGFAHVVNGQGEDAIAVTLLRIDPNEMGDIVDFTFKQPEMLGTQLRIIFDDIQNIEKWLTS